MAQVLHGCQLPNLDRIILIVAPHSKPNVLAGDQEAMELIMEHEPRANESRVGSTLEVFPIVNIAKKVQPLSDT